MHFFRNKIYDLKSINHKKLILHFAFACCIRKKKMFAKLPYRTVPYLGKIKAVNYYIALDSTGKFRIALRGYRLIC